MSELEEFESVKRWLSQGYSKGTQRIYLRYLEMICMFTKETPDSLVERVRRSPDPKKEVKEIDNAFQGFLDRKLKYKVTTQHDALSTLFSFLRPNGIEITREDIKDFHHGMGKISLRRWSVPELLKKS